MNDVEEEIESYDSLDDRVLHCYENSSLTASMPSKFELKLRDAIHLLCEVLEKEITGIPRTLF
jgi:hypothetical protein